jgi:hypothetical protein
MSIPTPMSNVTNATGNPMSMNFQKLNETPISSERSDTITFAADPMRVALPAKVEETTKVIINVTFPAGNISLIRTTAGTLLTRLDITAVNPAKPAMDMVSPSPNPGKSDTNSSNNPELETPPISTKRPMKNTKIDQSILPATHAAFFAPLDITITSASMPAVIAIAYIGMSKKPDTAKPKNAPNVTIRTAQSLTIHFFLIVFVNVNIRCQVLPEYGVNDKECNR